MFLKPAGTNKLKLPAKIDFKIKIFHRNLLKKIAEILGKNTNNKLETKGEQQDGTRRSKEELEGEKNDA